MTPFAFSDLMTKRGLHSKNLEIHHLTRSEHGLSNSKFGIAILNKIVTCIELFVLAFIRSGSQARLVQALHSQQPIPSPNEPSRLQAASHHPGLGHTS